MPTERPEGLKTPFRPCLFLATLLALAPSSLGGQLNLVAGAAHTQDLGGQWGADFRVGLDPPGMPVGIFGGADYFPGSCQKSCSLWGYRIGAILHPSTPAIQPYLTGAYVVRERHLDDTVEKRVGLAVGVGLRTTRGIRVQVEAGWEVLGNDLRYWVVRVGLGL